MAALALNPKVLFRFAQLHPLHILSVYSLQTQMRLFREG